MWNRRDVVTVVSEGIEFVSRLPVLFPTTEFISRDLHARMSEHLKVRAPSGAFGRLSRSLFAVVP